MTHEPIVDPRTRLVKSLVSGIKAGAVYGILTVGASELTTLPNKDQAAWCQGAAGIVLGILFTLKAWRINSGETWNFLPFVRIFPETLIIFETGSHDDK